MRDLSRHGARVATGLCAAVALLAQGGGAVGEEVGSETVTPIKHIIYIVGENRSFDNLYATYIPKRGETVSNLLSKGIVKEDGSPGPHFADAIQYRATGTTGKYSQAPEPKTPYTILPVPTILNAPAVPLPVQFGVISSTGVLSPAFPQGDPEIPLDEQDLLDAGGTGSIPKNGADTRVRNFSMLPPIPFAQTGLKLPYDSYEGDTIHQLSQMWQQSDCSMRHATRENPTGCLHDLYPFVATTYNTAPGQTPTDGSQDMAFYNMQAGDAPILKSLADDYTIGDNFHQAIMGGSVTGAIAIAFGDNAFFTDAHGNPAVPTGSITNPDPVPGTINTYQSVGTWIKCADRTQPGVAALQDYLASLPYRVSAKCAPNTYYAVRDAEQAYNADGSLAPVDPTTMPPLTIPHIGDRLDERHIPWAWYGGQYDAAVRVAKGSKTLEDQLFAAAYCIECNPFQYAKDVMTTPAGLAHLKDVTDLFNDIDNDTLPPVAFVKPDGTLEGHPATSKVDQFEAFIQNVIDRTKANPKLFADTAIVITEDESGGLYDSGFIQPLDFFGDGPRIPLIVVSPFSTGGHVVHTYYDQVSVLKFIERNWRLNRISGRSRDNLPNPVMQRDNPYVPANMPAIGDLFDLFHFEDEHHHPFPPFPIGHDHDGGGDHHGNGPF
ncbi:MAG TPA: alkaline phosphatase family protein [Aliidongia sp.]|nr:alkaline phosphatase family protein [Aliidongia sp.]